MTTTVRTIAFYLPQFHPIPENDAWWGEGFTEWTNVTQVRPRFRGHCQPQLPADLGFTDLRVPDVREAQAALAREHGLHGFCYYHYWFQGRRLLNRPFDEVLASGRPDFPFMLCWANENWTRRWDGQETEILVAQAYSEDDHRRHARSLAPAFADPRYLRVAGRPVFLVYKAGRIPEVRRATDVWREELVRGGLPEPYLMRVESAQDEAGDPRALGFDAAVEFQPAWAQLGWPRRHGWKARLVASLGLISRGWVENKIYDYPTVVRRMLSRPAPDYRRFPCVMPGWDNSARRKQGAIIMADSSPDLYGEWLAEVIRHRPAAGPGEDFVFINAWNEWAEGCHLEPCQTWGRGYLEATRRALAGAAAQRGAMP